VKIRHCMIAAGMLFGLLAASGASAQSCGNNDFNLTSDSSAQGLLVTGSSTGYRGYISSGNLAPGTWSISINDTGWPTATNSRRTYIRNTFYTYDAAAHVFRGSFPSSLVGFHIISTNMQFNGVATITMEAPDTNLNGVFDNTEFAAAQTFVTSASAPCGTSTPVCGGPGSGNGAAMGAGGVTNPIVGAMTTVPCAVAVDDAVWSDVKSLYRD